jgi:hypothetical protein
MQGRVERMGDVDVFAVLAQVGRPQAHREQQALELPDDVRQRCARREFDAPDVAGRALGVAPVMANLPQVARNRIDVEIRHQSCTQGKPCVRQPFRRPRW